MAFAPIPVVFLITVAACQPGPLIELWPDEVDYGTRAYGSDGTHRFHVINTGNEILKIETVLTSHGSLIARYENDRVQPGDSVEVVLKFDTTRIGPFSTAATVISNATNDPGKRIRVRGWILEQ